MSLVQFGTCALSKLSSVCEELSHALHYLECVKSHKSSLISKECQFDPARYSESNLNWCSTSSDMKVGLNKRQTDSHTRADNRVSEFSRSLEVEGEGGVEDIMQEGGGLGGQLRRCVRGIGGEEVEDWCN